jgi:hypothetical protein
MRYYATTVIFDQQTSRRDPKLILGSLASRTVMPGNVPATKRLRLSVYPIGVQGD